MQKIRDAISIFTSFMMFFLIPMYGLPFSGCPKIGYTTLELGCSSWPEFSRGALLVIPILLISNHKFLLSTLSILFTLVLATFGGLYNIRVGESWGYFCESWYKVYYHVSDPIFHGAIVVYVTFWMALTLHNKILKKDTKNYRGF